MKKKIKKPSGKKQKKRTPETARQWAFHFFEQWRNEDSLVRDSLQNAGNNSSEQHLGARWAERLILRIGTVDTVLSEAVSRSRDRVELPLWTLLQLGAAELLYGPITSQHAAISETVELCRFIGHPEWVGFLNGGLRGVQRLLVDDTTDSPGTDSYPAIDRSYRKVKKPLFPNPDSDFLRYLSIGFGIPDDLAKHWGQTFEKEQLIEIAWASLIPAPMTVRLNRMLVEPEQWLKKCEEQEIQVEKTEYPEAVRIKQSVRLSELPGFEEGEFAVQDETAMQAARILNPYPKQNVLDLCAGPGTKTTQMAELMLNQGRVLATEVVSYRLDQVNENAERLGFECIETLRIDRKNPVIPSGPFEAILVDAPCSNTGVLAKRPEARWRFSEEEVRELNRIQLHLLDTASDLLEEQGRLVFSTCSIDTRENEELIARWLKQNPTFACLEMKTILPNENRDGGFYALIEPLQEEEDEIQE